MKTGLNRTTSAHPLGRSDQFDSCCCNLVVFIYHVNTCKRVEIIYIATYIKVSQTAKSAFIYSGKTK